MATFLPSTSNVQGDVMQTLYLMKPPQYGGYNDATNAGNMVFVGPTGVVGQINNTSTNSNQPYPGVSLPSSLASATSSNSGQGNLLMDHMGGNSSYLSWSGGNDLSFLPSSDLTQSIGNLGQNSISDIPAYSMRSSPSIRDHIQIQSGPNKASSLPCQGLSLTLSSQNPVNSLPLHHSEARIANCVSEDEEGRYTNKLSNGAVSFRDLSQNPVLGSEVQNTTAFLTDERKYPFNPQVNPGTGLGNFLIGSKYLKVAHQLLEEVVNSGESNMKTSSSKHTKSMSSQIEFRTEPSSFIGSNSFTLSFGKEEPLQENQHKDGLQILSTTLTAAAEQGPRNISELTDLERQELQMKRAKLVAMLDEVDRRYRQYHNQMQAVVSSFQAAAGIGAAKTYTALPLQTISRYFRSLRDAIEGQIRATNRGLGESQAIQGFRRENAARLSFNDMRQQKCLQQFGMIQQQQSIWRPQRGLPEHAVSILRAWLFEHFLHPYPKDADKVMLAKQTGLTRSQVSNWFINARVRLWKPMVEEMYIQETTRGVQEEEEEEEEERESSAKSSERKSPGESASKGTSVVDDDIVEDRGSESLKEERNDDVFKELVMGTTSEHPQRGPKGGQGLSTVLATRLNCHYQEEEEEDMGLIMMRQVAKRAKNNESGVGFEGMMMMMGDVEPNNSSRMFSNALHSLHPQESKGVGLAIADGMNQHQHHHQHQQVMMRHDGFEAYQHHRENENDGDDDVGASRFGHFSSNPPSHAQSLAAISRYNSAGNVNNNVSLTLGLQNCDGGLSLSGAPTHPHHFFQSHMTKPSSSTAVVHEDRDVTEDYFKPCYR